LGGVHDLPREVRIAPPRNPLPFIALLAMVVGGIVLTALLVAPFLSALTWAFALAVVANPLHRRIERRFPHPNMVAAASVLVVTLGLLIPTSFVVWQVGSQASQGFTAIQEQLSADAVRDLAGRIPGGRALFDQIVGARGDGSLGPAVQQQAGTWVKSAAYGLFQILVAIFALFFLLRDREAALKAARSYMPMSDREADYFFDRIHQMTYATLYGNVVTAVVQGTLGGLMFALLGIKGALLWGVVMALLSIVPVSGSFLIWIPAAVVLAVHDDWVRAGILGVWGTIVVGSIDNLLMPWLVGKQIRLHTLPVFLSLVGGLIVFGAAGLVLGPVIAAATVAMLDILKKRAKTRRPISEPKT
jgi:predicted PurR-regulated permease PerM